MFPAPIVTEKLRVDVFELYHVAAVVARELREVALVEEWNQFLSHPAADVTTRDVAHFSCRGERFRDGVGTDERLVVLGRGFPLPIRLRHRDIPPARLRPQHRPL